jgi:aspartate/methionine/tyrosine aminotransferase
MFPTMPYLEWIWGRPERATYDLGSSDLRTYRPDGSVVPEPLRGLDDPGDDGPSLEEYIAEEYDVSTDEVLVAAGATHANFVAAATALGISEEENDVLVEKPGYGPLLHTPDGLGARVTRFMRPPEEDYALSPKRVADAATQPTTLVTVTNRHNPTGRMVDRETLSAVAEAAADVDAHLLVDEVYGPYVGEAAQRTAFGGVTGAGLPNTIATGSLTKFHGLGGLRIGWLVAPEAFVERAKRTLAHVPAISAPSVALARRFFAHRDELVERSRAHLRRNHEMLASFVADRDDLSGTIHEGCTFGLVAHDAVDGETLAEAAWEEGVLVVPGTFLDEPEGIRLSAGRDPDEVEAGLSVLGDVLDGL